jgi:hypothetical protein
MTSARWKTFSLAYGVVYMGFFLYSEVYRVAMFRYYPVLSRFSREALPLESAGPPILWYSWLAGAAVVSAVIAALVPSRVADRMGPSLVCGIPAAVLLLIVVYERRWFY